MLNRKRKWAGADGAGLSISASPLTRSAGPSASQKSEASQAEAENGE